MKSDLARNEILDSVRKSLRVSNKDQQRKRVVLDHLRYHKRNLIPQRSIVDGVNLVELLTHYLKGQQANIIRIKNKEELPAAISEFLKLNNLPSRIRCGNDPHWDAIPWDQKPSLERIIGPANADDRVSLSLAFGAAAETGTLFLLSGPENPTSNNFLPETHIVMLQSSDISGPYEDVWTRLRKTPQYPAMPRTVNLISGPSRTADIEQTIALGAHGPRQLCVIIVEE